MSLKQSHFRTVSQLEHMMRKRGQARTTQLRQIFSAEDERDDQVYGYGSSCYSLRWGAENRPSSSSELGRRIRFLGDPLFGPGEEDRPATAPEAGAAEGSRSTRVIKGSSRVRRQLSEHLVQARASRAVHEDTTSEGASGRSAATSPSQSLPASARSTLSAHEQVFLNVGRNDVRAIE